MSDVQRLKPRRDKGLWVRPYRVNKLPRAMRIIVTTEIRGEGATVAAAIRALRRQMKRGRN